MDSQSSPTMEIQQAKTLLPLSLSSLQPASYSRHAQRLVQLKQLGELHVSAQPNEDKNCFVIKSSILKSNIPTRSKRIATSLLSANFAADLVVSKSLAEFIELRDFVYHSAQISHPVERCSFCNHVVKCFRMSLLHPRTLLIGMVSKEKRAEMLEDFLRALLQLAISTPTNVSRTCLCQEQTPRQLHKFLFES